MFLKPKGGQCNFFNNSTLEKYTSSSLESNNTRMQRKINRKISQKEQSSPLAYQTKAFPNRNHELKPFKKLKTNLSHFKRKGMIIFLEI